MRSRRLPGLGKHRHYRGGFGSSQTVDAASLEGLSVLHPVRFKARLGSSSRRDGKLVRSYHILQYINKTVLCALSRINCANVLHRPAILSWLE